MPANEPDGYWLRWASEDRKGVLVRTEENIAVAGTQNANFDVYIGIDCGFGINRVGRKRDDARVTKRFNVLSGLVLPEHARPYALVEIFPNSPGVTESERNLCPLEVVQLEHRLHPCAAQSHLGLGTNVLQLEPYSPQLRSLNISRSGSTFARREGAAARFALSTWNVAEPSEPVDAGSLAGDLVIGSDRPKIQGRSDR